MQSVLNEKNAAIVSGKVANSPKLSHEIYGEGFYLFELEIQRISGNYDRIPIMISERLMPIADIVPGKYLFIEGQYRSHNMTKEKNSKLVLMVFAREVRFIDESLENSSDTIVLDGQGDIVPYNNMNVLLLDGTICREPVFRVTPLKREICDILVAVNRLYNKSDYIPCISWGRNARFCGTLHVGQRIKISGRIQSRNYTKLLPNGDKVERTAYEVSALSVQTVTDAEET